MPSANYTLYRASNANIRIHCVVAPRGDLTQRTERPAEGAPRAALHSRREVRYISSGTAGRPKTGTAKTAIVRTGPAELLKLLRLRTKLGCERSHAVTGIPLSGCIARLVGLLSTSTTSECLWFGGADSRKLPCFISIHIRIVSFAPHIRYHLQEHDLGVQRCALGRVDG